MMDKILIGVATAALWFALSHAAHAAQIRDAGCHPGLPDQILGSQILSCKILS
jgi:hypothetical protein